MREFKDLNPEGEQEVTAQEASQVVGGAGTPSRSVVATRVAVSRSIAGKAGNAAEGTVMCVGTGGFGANVQKGATQASTVMCIGTGGFGASQLGARAGH